MSNFAPKKDTARRALEHITIMNLYEKLAGDQFGEVWDKLGEIGCDILKEYIEENPT